MWSCVGDSSRKAERCSLGGESGRMAEKVVVFWRQWSYGGDSGRKVETVVVRGLEL